MLAYYFIIINYGAKVAFIAPIWLVGEPRALKVEDISLQLNATNFSFGDSLIYVN